MYIDGKITDDELVQEIDSEVVTAKNRDEWRREYMTLEMEINRREKAAMAKGMAKGMAQGMLKALNALVQQKLLTLADAAKQANMSVEAFTKAVAML